MSTSKPIKEVYLIRHGESEYNQWRRNSFRNPCTLLCVRDPMLFDAPLSRAGEAQVRALRRALWSMTKDNAFAIGPRVELVVTSPLTRAVETCLGGFFPEHSYIKDDDNSSSNDDNTETKHEESGSACVDPRTRQCGPKPLCLALNRERLDTSCDVGTPLSELTHKYGERLDMSAMGQREMWWYDEDPGEGVGPHTICRERVADVRRRTQAFREWLSCRTERVIAVVGHSAFFKHLTGMGRKLRNCEVWRFDVEDKSGGVASSAAVVMDQPGVVGGSRVSTRLMDQRSLVRSTAVARV